MTLYEKAWQVIRKRIDDAAAAAGRDPSSIRVLAVSKGFSSEAIRTACTAGQRAFGENYVQEAIPKIDALAESAGAPIPGGDNGRTAPQIPAGSRPRRYRRRRAVTAERDAATRERDALVRQLSECQRRIDHLEAEVERLRRSIDGT